MDIRQSPKTDVLVVVSNYIVYELAIGTNIGDLE